MQIATIGHAATMSSLEISELVESNHADVRRSIERLSERGVIALTPLAEVSNPGPGPRFVKVYNLDKRSSLIVVAQLCPEFTARIVDRWQELEAAATQPAPQPDPRFAVPYADPAVAMLSTQLACASLLNVPVHLAQVEAVKEVRLTMAVDFTNMLRLSSNQQNIAHDDACLEPTELGKLVGLDAVNMNRRLATAGYQIRANGEWIATEKADGYAFPHHWVKKDKSGYNLKWKRSILDQLKISE